MVVPSEMLAHGSQVRKRAVDIQALRQVWVAEVNQALQAAVAQNYTACACAWAIPTLMAILKPLGTTTCTETPCIDSLHHLVGAREQKPISTPIRCTRSGC